MKVYEVYCEGNSTAKPLLRTLDWSRTGVIANLARQVHGSWAGFPDDIRQWAEKRLNTKHEGKRDKTPGALFVQQVEYAFEGTTPEYAYIDVEEDWHKGGIPLGRAMLDPFADFLGLAQAHYPKTLWGFYSNIWHPWDYWGLRQNLPYVADKQAHFKRVIAPFLREKQAALFTNVYQPYPHDPHWAAAAKAHLTSTHKAVKPTAPHIAMLAARHTSGPKSMVSAEDLGAAIETIRKLGFVDAVLLWHDINDEAGRDEAQRHIEEVVAAVVPGRAAA